MRAAPPARIQHPFVRTLHGDPFTGSETASDPARSRSTATTSTGTCSPASSSASSPTSRRPMSPASFADMQRAGFSGWTSHGALMTLSGVMRKAKRERLIAELEHDERPRTETGEKRVLDEGGIGALL